jgi:hypothetical protein
VSADTGQKGEQPDPLGVLEHLLKNLPPDQLARGVDALRKITRAYVREARAHNLTLQEAEENVRGAVEGAHLAVPLIRREELIARLVET